MTYSEMQAARVRKELAGRSGIVEKQMFGGIAFLLGGNMAVGVRGEDLIVRVEPARPTRCSKSPVRSRSTSAAAAAHRPDGSSLRNPGTRPTWPYVPGSNVGSRTRPRCRRRHQRSPRRNGSAGRASDLWTRGSAAAELQFGWNSDIRI